MKKTFITALLAVCCGLYSNAQNFSFGIKAGFSLSTMSHDEDPIKTQHPFQPGVTAGFFGQYDFTDMFGLSTELLYGLQGFNSDMESFIPNLNSKTEQCCNRIITICLTSV